MDATAVTERVKPLSPARYMLPLPSKSTHNRYGRPLLNPRVSKLAVQPCEPACKPTAPVLLGDTATGESWHWKANCTVVTPATQLGHVIVICDWLPFRNLEGPTREVTGLTYTSMLELPICCLELRPSMSVQSHRYEPGRRLQVSSSSTKSSPCGRNGQASVLVPVPPKQSSGLDLLSGFPASSGWRSLGTQLPKNPCAETQLAQLTFNCAVGDSGSEKRCGANAEA
mmetsp:Transcript_126812/g.301250  ORF Transcript_126812/g.301250 Transcript_126812/m.301250 type:complete len:227 (+) Transcript_126812:1820-2500(+)